MIPRENGLGLTPDYLAECFEYNPQTGDVFWKVRPAHHFSDPAVAKGVNKRMAGRRAGGSVYRETETGQGPRVMLDRVNHSLPQLLYLMMTGIWADCVTSRDGNAQNLKYLNLLPVTECQMYWYWRNLRKSQKAHFMKADQNWRVGTKFQQTTFSRYFKQKEDAEAFSDRVENEVMKYILGQDPSDLKDAPLFELLSELYGESKK